MEALGFRVVPHCGGYQVQRIGADGRVTSVGPAPEYAWKMWELLGREAGGYERAQAEILDILKTAPYDEKALSMIGHWLDGPTAGEGVIPAAGTSQTS